MFNAIKLQKSLLLYSLAQQVQCQVWQFESPELNINHVQAKWIMQSKDTQFSNL